MIEGVLVYDPALRPAWLAADREARLFVGEVAAPPPAHAPLLSLHTREGSRPLVVRAPGGEPLLLFDPRACFEIMTCERWRTFRAPAPRLPVDYHVVPAGVRNALIAGVGRVARWVRPAEPFPRWPQDESLELLMALLDALGLGAACPPRPRWPGGGRAAFCVTHDVDSAEAQAGIGRISEMEASLGVRSAWFFTTGAFPLDHGRLRSLREAGHEIGSHDASHDMRTPFLPPHRIRERLRASRDALEPYGVRGYRAPGLARAPALYEVARDLFDYDSSVPDTESFAGVIAAGGAMAVRPFERGGMLTLPITLPQDVMYLWRRLEPAAILASLRAKIAWIKAVGGMALLLTHPEPARGGSDAYIDVVRRLLEEVRADEALWMATPAEVVDALRG